LISGKDLKYDDTASTSHQRHVPTVTAPCYLWEQDCFGMAASYNVIVLYRFCCYHTLTGLCLRLYVQLSCLLLIQLCNFMVSYHPLCLTS